MTGTYTAFHGHDDEPAGEVIRVNGGDPHRGLIPSDTVEGFGGRVTDLLFAGLYGYDAEGRPVPSVLESLTTEDNRRFRITLHADRTFTDGSPVTAASFVDAWNFAAAPENRQAGRAFFADIEGYGETGAASTAAAAAAQASDRGLSGLRLDGEFAFSVTLRRPDPDFPSRLGLLAFRPLPKVFFEVGPEEFGRAPVGNGPYLLAGPEAWREREWLELVANPGYRGPDRPRNAGIRFVFHPDPDTALESLRAGQLDVLDIVPMSVLPTYREDLGERAVVREIALNKSLAIPCDLPHFGGEEGRLRRTAISLALDRSTITRQLFHGTRRPARDFTARVLPGFDGGLPGSEVLEFDPDSARRAWSRAEKIEKWSGVLRIAINENGGHDLWMRAVAEQIHACLGIDVEVCSYPTFRDIRARIADGTLGSAFRKGWRGDRPALLDFLEPIFTTGAVSNDLGYANPAFDAALAEAKAAPDSASMYRLIGRAQSILLHDLPVIPLWDYLNVSCVGEDVSAPITWNGFPDYPRITKGRRNSGLAKTADSRPARPVRPLGTDCAPRAAAAAHA